MTAIKIPWKKVACSKVICTLTLFAGIMILSISLDKRLSVTCLDIGQGDGIVLQLPDNRNFLIDGGAGFILLRLSKTTVRIRVGDFGGNAFGPPEKGRLIVYFYVCSSSLPYDSVKSRTCFPKNMYDFSKKHVRVFRK